MSLVVFGSSSRVGQGIIRHLYNSGKYETIICADMFPNYGSVQRFLFFKQSLGESASKTKIVDTKVSQKSDLYKTFSSSSSDVVYVTHMHFSNTASKLNLIKTTASLTKELKKNLICVTPVELDHYGESDPEIKASKSESDAKATNPELNLIKSDITFGNDATAISSLLFNIVNGQNLTFKPSSASPAPVHVEALAQAVEKLIAGKNKGESFLAQGTKRISWQSIVSTLETNSGYKAKLNSDVLHTIASPLSNNLLSEFFFKECDRNLQQLINKYKIPDPTGLQDISTLGVKTQEFDEYYQKNTIPTANFTWKDTCTERYIKQVLY